MGEPNLSQAEQVSQGGEPTVDRDDQFGLLGYDCRWLKLERVRQGFFRGRFWIPVRKSRTKRLCRNFNFNVESKPSPTWTIDSKQTTPEYIREEVVDETAHWKSLCELNRQRLLDSGITTAELEEIRCSNLNTDYWKFEAELYNAEFWRLQQLRQPQIKRRKTTKLLHEKPKSSPGDDPVSSRLRKRTSHDSKISKNSSNTLLGNRRNRSRGTGTNAKPRGVKSKS